MPPRPAFEKRSNEVHGAQARQLTVDVLTKHLPVAVAGTRYRTADVYQILVAAAVQQRSLESVCAALPEAPRANTIRYHVAEQLLYREELDTLEAQCNALLTAHLPTDLVRHPQRLAVDLTLLPYYGQPAVEAGELRRGEAKAGTTRFHAYATVYVTRAGRRCTLALTAVRADDDLLDVLLDLLGRVRRLGITIERLYLDREFATVTILRTLQAQPFLSIVPVPKRGQRLTALLRGRTSFQTTYTMESAAAGSVTFPLWVACHYAAGRPSKQAPQHGIEYQTYAVVGPTPPTLTVSEVAHDYRHRFGIESSYRMSHQVQVPTTSRSPAWRLLLLTLAFLLLNLWLWLKATLVLATAWGYRRAARAWLDATCRLDVWRDLLREAILAHYGVRQMLTFPFPLTHSLPIAEY
jgi:DDE family transposase